jgi:peptide/nickel transport system substrate-binding protein
LVSTRKAGAIGALIAIALLAASCGGGTSSTTDGKGPDGTAAPSDAVKTDITVKPATTAKRGGTLVYGLEADTDGFDPAVNRWAAVGLIMAGAVFDPLAAYDDQGNARPYLAESFEPSKDHRSWTIKLRAGVKFHNGEPVNADAVGAHLTRMRRSPLSGPAMDPVDEANPITKKDELTLVVNMTSPWVAFPVALTGQGGMVPAPEQMAIADTAERSMHPIGSGPFVFKEWTPNEKMTVARNESYWREGLPYLDKVEFRPLSDPVTRVGALQKGDVNMLLSTSRDSIDNLERLAREGSAQVVRDAGPQEKLFLMFNMAKPPFDDVRVRRAVAYAIDLDAYSKASGDDPAWQIDGLFTPSSPWYTKTDFPRRDLDKAKALIDEVTKTSGPLKTSVSASDAPDSQAVAQSFAQTFKSIGIDATVESYPQSELITKVLFGQYGSVYWRQFGSPDPDGDFHWWIGKNAVNPGEGRLGLNFARLRDKEVDDALIKARENADVNVRKEAYATVQRRFAELVPYVWLDLSVKVIGADMQVRGITNGPLPDGTASMPVTGGVTRLTQVWIDA